MDPRLRTDAAFSAVANPSSSYTLAEIWRLGPIERDGGLGLRMGNLGESGGLGDRDGSPVESTVMEPSGGGNVRKRRDFSSEDESSKLVATTSSAGNELNDSNVKRMKIPGSKNENGSLKAEIETTSAIHDMSVEQPNKPSEPPKQDYIHVRARRGQATDSHSLAERARREKISERMQKLQDLVPGCNKVIGKALVLDEIINYILSLQQQVEFLSMKLEAVTSRTNMQPPSIEGLHPKDVGVQPFEDSGMIFGQQAAREYAQGSQVEWLHMQVGGSFE